jgi:hypothetical protein
VSHTHLIADANRLLKDINEGREVPGTKNVKKALAYLVQRGQITNTPETTPRLRLTERGRAALSASA